MSEAKVAQWDAWKHLSGLWSYPTSVSMKRIKATTALLIEGSMYYLMFLRHCLRVHNNYPLNIQSVNRVLGIRVRYEYGLRVWCKTKDVARWESGHHEFPLDILPTHDLISKPNSAKTWSILVHRYCGQIDSLGTWVAESNLPPVLPRSRTQFPRHDTMPISAI